MLKAVLIPVFLLTAVPNISLLPVQISNPVSPYNFTPLESDTRESPKGGTGFSISSSIISPDSTDDILTDITIAYTLKDKSSVSFKLTQDGKIISTITEKPSQSPGGDMIIWNGRDEKVGYVPDGLYAIEFYVNDSVIKTVPIEVKSLVAKINVPVDGALVRAQVPVFGIACGRNFKKYIIEYAKQDAPDEWVTIEESSIPKADNTKIADLSAGDETIHGNLATWDTGLKEYYYYDTDVDLSGSYVLRLTVFDEKGNKAVDEVNVDIGTIVSFIYGGRVESADKKAALVFEEHSIKTPFVLFNIKEAPREYAGNLSKKQGYRLIGKIYEIEPEGVSFGMPASLAMRYDSNDVKDDTRTAVYAYDPDLGVWKYLPGERRGGEKRTLAVKLAGTQALYAYYAIFERTKDIAAPVLYDLPKEAQFNIVDISGEAEAGREVEIYINGRKTGKTSADRKTGIFKLTRAALSAGKNEIIAKAIDESGKTCSSSNIITTNVVLRNPKRACSKLKDSEFKAEGFDEWKNLDGEEGASLSLDNEATPDGTYCLRLVNKKYGGSFGAIVRSAPYDAEKHPVVSFDYKIPPGVKINFLVKAGKRWYDIQFTDDDKNYERVNMVKIGRISNAACDDKWHHAEFNLYEMLKRYTGNKIIEQMILADYDVTGFMKLGYGRNPEGAVFYIDNFAISKAPQKTASPDTSQTRWEIGNNDGSNNEFLYEKEAGDDYYAGGAIEDFERAVTKFDPVTNIHFYLSGENSKKKYNFFIKAKDWDMRNYDYVDFDVLLNSGKIASLRCPYKDGTAFNINTGKNLKEGKNVLTLEWKGGGDWVSWDYLKFEPMNCGIKKPCSNWEIGYNDNSFSEFSHEMDTGDDYSIDEDFKSFERAVSVQDPITNIRFYLDKNMLNADYELFIKPFDIQSIDSQPKMSGAFFKILVNGRDNGARNVTPLKEPLCVIIPMNSLKEGENIISLKWLAGCDWIMWDYLKFNPIKKDEKL